MFSQIRPSADRDARDRARVFSLVQSRRQRATLIQSISLSASTCLLPSTGFFCFRGYDVVGEAARILHFHSCWMKPVWVQPRFRLWRVRPFSIQHASHRRHAVEVHLACDPQAQVPSRWSRIKLAPVAMAGGNLFKHIHATPFALVHTCPTSASLLPATSSVPRYSPRPVLAAISTTARTRSVDGMMGRSATKTAVAQARRGVHTSSRKSASPAAVASAGSSLADISSVLEKPRQGTKKAASIDPESDEDVPTNVDEVQKSLSRPPPVNSDYLPLPWKGRLGYACLNTYLRNANPPVFSSRTCRIASILENRHPLQDPSQPYHATKNRPDRTKPADIAKGQAFVEALGVANARDIVKMLRWNDRYGIKFMRLSSEMFPFASHEVYGYKLEPFASEALADAGRVAAELGHRLTMHPGQFTQLGSPRKEVTINSIRDLEFHSELLQLLKLPPQQNRDAVMILHMGGVFGDKAATLDRFRDSYSKLSQDIKNRLVLENDDVSWSVHDLLPICEELNIPLVLDFHHHNIVFDDDKMREGTQDIMQLFDRIRATWTRKGITQKMHYSEPTPEAITPSQRRKHNPRVANLPPCDPTMDLMIEAKDKEQAVFELMRKYKLPGHDRFADVVPHVREDENKTWKPPKRTKKSSPYVELSDLEPPPSVDPEEFGMGGPEGRVYWPPGHEDWLRPKKRVISRKKTGVEDAVDETATSPAKTKASPKKAKSKGNQKADGKETPKRRKRKPSKASVTSSSDEKELSSPSPSEPQALSTVKSTPARRGRPRKKVNYAEDESS